MSVIVNGIKMPKSCDVCDFVYDLNEGDLGTHNYCGFPGIGVYVDDCIATRHKDCPLGEVPEPHGRLGDLDRLEQMFADIDNAPYSGFDGTEPFYSAEDAAQIIRLAPTIIKAEE